MIYMRARYYAPTTGRFISEDPARDGSNWFVYCGNDPVGNSDMDGRMTQKVAAMATAIGYFLYFAGTFLAGAPTDLKEFGGFALTGLFKLATGEALTFFPKVFPVLNKVATAFAESFSGGLLQDGSRASRGAAYAEFWVGYGSSWPLLSIRSVIRMT